MAKELAAVPGVDKELEGVLERRERAGETAGTASEPRQIVAQFGVVAFDLCYKSLYFPPIR